MKKLASLMLVLAMSMFTIGCGDTAGTDEAAPNGDATDTDTTEQAAESADTGDDATDADTTEDAAEGTDEAAGGTEGEAGTTEP